MQTATDPVLAATRQRMAQIDACHPQAARILRNPYSMTKATDVVAHSIAIATGEKGWTSLCCWCLDKVDPGHERLALRTTHGGACFGCSYVGPDCLVVEPERVAKSPVKSITLTRAEDLEHECGKPVTVSTWDAASATLSGWAWTAPKGGGYDKCLFTVEWANGETYQGRFDLEYRHVMDARLEHQIGRFLRYVLKTPGIAAAEMVETARRMLETVSLA